MGAALLFENFSELRCVRIFPANGEVSVRRIEGWRTNCRVQWLLHRFRSGPRSGFHDGVSTPPLISRVES